MVWGWKVPKKSHPLMVLSALALGAPQIFCDNWALLGQRAWDGTPCPPNGWDCLFLRLGVLGGGNDPGQSRGGNMGKKHQRPGKMGGRHGEQREEQGPPWSKMLRECRLLKVTVDAGVCCRRTYFSVMVFSSCQWGNRGKELGTTAMILDAVTILWY